MWFLVSLLLVLSGNAPWARAEKPGQLTLSALNAERLWSSEQPAAVSLRRFSADYQVGPGDRLDIQVIGHDDLRQDLRVLNSGEVSFPMLGLIPVRAMTTFEIEDEIARRFKEAGLVEQSEVLVTVTEYQSRLFYIWGAVENPGQYVMSQELTVVDAILLAGGLRFNAADHALLHRRSNSEPVSLQEGQPAEGNTTSESQGTETITIDLRPLKEARFFERFPTLHRGDVLVVPDQPMDAFFVVGDVVDPRNFFYAPDTPLTVSQAISWAGGPTSTAKVSDGLLVRYDDEGRRTEIKFDYAAILKGRQVDIPIRPYDILFIPGSAVKSLTQGLLRLSDNMVMAASFRIARTYQLPDGPGATRPGGDGR